MKPKSRGEWLEARKHGIGGSDAASIVGMNPYKTKLELWEEKTGRKEAEDISDKPAVAYGKKAERFLRDLFKLDYPQYQVSYSEFEMLSALPDCPWLFATLDGKLKERGTKRHGILEIKTTEIKNPKHWERWDERIPDAYYIQILHQLLATGFDFAILKAQIKWKKDDVPTLTTRHYFIDRKEVAEDLEYLLEKEKEFWTFVEKDVIPE